MHTLTIHQFSPSDSRLGRHVRHDSQSKAFAFLPRDAKAKQISTFFDSGTGPLDQGNVGSCTGNATVQTFNSHFFDRMRAKTRPASGYFNEADAIKVYALGTHNDNVKGFYPPNDTGCSGLGVAQAAKQLGYIDKYSHIFSFNSAQAAAEVSPFIQGTIWTNSMFKPVNGLVTVGALTASNVAGGHEYEGAGIDWKNEVFIYRNSWGDQDAWPGCKPGGYFAISFDDVRILLENQGDITVLHGVGLS